ncbi:MAG TPA: pilus assembly protein PilM [Firmicutes bacterium]|nr:pilus assembly protein PilM [Bacillota bacterium]
MTSTLGLDIGGAAVKFVELMTTRAGSRVKKYGCFTVPPNLVADGLILEPHELGRYIKETLHTEGVHTHRVACAVNGSSVLFRRVELPPLPVETLKQSLRWELERYVPFTATAVEYGLLPLEQLPQKTIALLATAPQTVITSLLTTLEAADLFPEVLEPGPLALLRWVEYSRPPAEKNILILDLGATSTKVLILREGQLQFVRTSLVNQEEKRAPWEGVATEIRRSLDYYALQYPASPAPGPTACFCLGGSAQDDFLRSRLEAVLGLHVQLLDSAQPALRDAALLGTALGLALGGIKHQTTRILGAY